MDCLLKTNTNYKNLKITGGSKYIYKKKLGKTCFQHYMVYENFKDLPLRTTSDKVLLGKPFNIAENLKYDGYQCRLASMIYKFFYKNSTGTSTHSGTGINVENQQLAEELHKPVIRTFENHKVYPSFNGPYLGSRFSRYAINK